MVLRIRTATRLPETNFWLISSIQIFNNYSYRHSLLDSPDVNSSCVPTPAQRLRLGNYPTPLQQWKFSWKDQSYQFMIKRDDLTDMAASGNKMRKLEFILPEVVVGNYDCSLKSAHVLVKTSKNELSFSEGNLFFHNLFGSELFFVSREEHRLKGQEAILKETSEKLIESGTVLDSTYTIKALKTYLESGKIASGNMKCLFLHTGGMFSLMGRNEYLE